MNPLVIPSWFGCPHCGGLGPDGADGDLVCRCGSGDQAGAAWWTRLVTDLWARSSGRCEAQTPWCTVATPHGGPGALRGVQAIVHHRSPNTMDRTDRRAAMPPDLVLLMCGTRLAGCHAWCDHDRAGAYQRGLLIRPCPAQTMRSGQGIRSLAA